MEVCNYYFIYIVRSLLNSCHALFFIVWFDVQREGRRGYHEAQVIELDLESNIRRVKFHFWKLSSDRDEWVEIGSPRIAPHVSSVIFCL